MGCGTCGIASKKDGKTQGCKSKGNCSTGGCNRLNTYNWLADLPSSGERDSFNIVEVSFKNGSTKGYYKNNLNSFVITGDDVVVETNYGFHLGRVSLSGELVRLQMRKKRIKENSDKITRVLRIATESDLEKAIYYAGLEREVMIKARIIARDLGLEMKIGDVEYQADGRKIIFYYTADARVDFRELIKIFAREFRVRVEMMQIGPRQEAGKIGGIGSCGRELCCSTWLTDFKPVQTSVARYQNLSVNQTKLSGQCGRLKCCLNFELDSYLDALKAFPKNAYTLKLKETDARLVKTDIFKQKMWYGIPRSPLVMLDIDRVNEILEMNARGEKPESLIDPTVIKSAPLLDDLSDYSNTVEQIDLPDLKRKKRKNKKKKANNRGKSKGPNSKGSNSKKQSDDNKGDSSNKQSQGKNRSSQEPSHKPNSDKTRSDRSRSDRSRSDRSRSDRSRSDKSRSSNQKRRNQQSNKPDSTKREARKPNQPSENKKIEPNKDKSANTPNTKPSNTPKASKPNTGEKPNDDNTKKD